MENSRAGALILTLDHELPGVLLPVESNRGSLIGWHSAWTGS